MEIVSREEHQVYKDYLEDKYGRKVKDLVVDIDGDFVDLHFKFAPVEFSRIRRITGYLTGDTSGWNNAKQEELSDRVKHGGIEQL